MRPNSNKACAPPEPRGGCAVKQVTISRGRCKDQRPEPVASLTIRAGESLAVVGPTGSGKSQLLSDIEQVACGDTVSQRRIAIDTAASAPPDHPAGLVAQLTQKTGFIMDCSVAEFLTLHARSRGKSAPALVDRVLAAANTLCGEPVARNSSLQMLSGGQSRALMIADIAHISDAPVVLIDEIENAGIDKLKALSVLASSHKPILISTHDPVLVLMTTKRVVMKNGGMTAVHHTCPAETEHLAALEKIDRIMGRTREALRNGNTINGDNRP